MIAMRDASAPASRSTRIALAHRRLCCQLPNRAGRLKSGIAPPVPFHGCARSRLSSKELIFDSVLNRTNHALLILDRLREIHQHLSTA